MPRQPGQPGQPKRKKSAYGGGSVYPLKDGRYAASIKDPVSGKRIVRYGKTRKEAEKRLEDIKFEIRQGTLATGPDQTVEKYMVYWLEEIHRPLIGVATYERYRGIVYNYIIPVIGHIHLQKLSPYHIQNVCNKAKDAGLAPGSIGKIRQVLHTALDKAVSWNLVTRNVCDVVLPPRAPRAEHPVLTIDQARHLLRVARGHRLEGLLTLVIATGMRKGELVALKWEDINFEEGSLQIRRSMARIGSHGIVTKEPKTARGRRKIILPQFVIDALKQHRAYQLERKAEAGPKWEENNFVFPNIYGRYLDATIVHRLFKKLLVEAGFPDMRFHDLRHSAATILLSMGVHPKVVQELLGHSQISITMDTYSHVLPSVQKEAMNKLNDLFNQWEEG